MKISKVKLVERMNEFAKHFNSSLESLKKACEIYAQTIREDFSTAKSFHEKFEFISITTWDKMNLVGTGVIDVQLLVLTDRVANKIAQLPIDKQKEILVKPFEVYKQRGGKDGGIIKTEKLIKNMKEAEFDKVFTEDMKPRPKDEQLEIIKDGITKSKPCYEINGKILIVHRKTQFTKQQLELIIKSMR